MEIHWVSGGEREGERGGENSSKEGVKVDTRSSRGWRQTMTILQLRNQQGNGLTIQ